MLRVFANGVAPDVLADGVPWCSDRCPKLDGKRCLITFRKPETICVPAVRQMREIISNVEWKE